MDKMVVLITLPPKRRQTARILYCMFRRTKVTEYDVIALRSFLKEAWGGHSSKDRCPKNKSKRKQYQKSKRTKGMGLIAE